MTSSAVRTAARVASEIPGLPFRTRLTVASLTPACFATSASFPATLQLYDKTVQVPLPARGLQFGRSAPVAQWIEQRFPKPRAQVRFFSGAWPERACKSGDAVATARIRVDVE